MIRRWRIYIAWLALLLTLTACPSDPPQVLVATATGQASGEGDPYDRENPAPAFSTVQTGALRLTLLSFERAPTSINAEPLEPGPPGTDLAALSVRVECLEDDDHCDLTVSEFQILAGDDLFLPIEDFSSGDTLVPGPMQQSEVQQTILYYFLPLDQSDFVFRFNPLYDLWVETIYIALPE